MSNERGRKRSGGRSEKVNRSGSGGDSIGRSRADNVERSGANGDERSGPL